jgi:adenine/guanine phosphoribosyltransferase-like PRPP-binding protein
VLLNDLLVTGSTLAASIALLVQVGAHVSAACMELALLQNRKKLKLAVTLLKYYN